MQIVHQGINLGILVLKLVHIKIKHSLCLMYDTMVIRTQNNYITRIIISRFSKKIYMVRLGDVYSIHYRCSSTTDLTTILI